MGSLLILLLAVAASTGLAVAGASPFYVDKDATGANNGTSWDNAFTVIQPAIDAAFTAGGGEVWVAEGTYSEARTDADGSLVMKNGVALYGGFIGAASGGYETQRDARNWAAHVTTIDGATARGGSVAYHVVKGASAVLDGFTITGGNATGGSSYEQTRGGGMVSQDCAPVVSNCIFTANRAVEGGAMRHLNTVTGIFRNCRFVSNAAKTVGSEHGSGGAVSSSSPNVQSDTSLFENCVFDSNTADWAAGAIYNGSQTFRGCRFVNQTVQQNGGACFLSWNSNATFENCLFQNNRSHTGGSAIVLGSGLQKMVNCTIAQNVSDTSAMVVDISSDPAYLTNCIIYGNTGPSIGGDGTKNITYCNVEGGFTGTGNINADPLFVNSGSGDYSLQAASPCIDAGTSVSLTTDYASKPRPVDVPGVGGEGAVNAFDMGAYEYQAAPTPTVSPTPTSEEPLLEILSVTQLPDKKIEIRYRLTPHDPAPAGGYDVTALAKATAQNCQDTASDPDSVFDEIIAYASGDKHIAPAGGEGTLVWDVRGMPQGALRDKFYRANVSILFRLRATPVNQ